MSDTVRMPPDHERQQEMPLDPPQLRAWADLYNNNAESSVPATAVSPSRRDRDSDDIPVDPVQRNIRETEQLCAELDRLRTATLFANAELTELLHVLSMRTYEEERHLWQHQCSQRQRQQQLGEEGQAEEDWEAGGHFGARAGTGNTGTDMDDDAVSYRAALPSDIAALDAFARQSFRDTFFEACAYTEADLQQYYDETYQPHHWLQLISDSQRHVLLARTRNRGSIVGYACVGGPTELPVELEEAERARSGDLLRCYVATDFHGKGVAKSLVDQSLPWLLQRFSGDVYIGVWSENWRARGFYEKMGAKVVHEYLYPVGDKDDREFVMRVDRADIEAYVSRLAAQESNSRYTRMSAAAAGEGALDLSSVQATSVSSGDSSSDYGIGSTNDDGNDSNAGLSPLQCLSKLESLKLRPLLQALAKLKWGTFGPDYANVDAHVAAAAEKSQGAADTVFLCEQRGALASHQQPHHALFLEHLGLFVNALLMGAKVAEIRERWADCATVYDKVVDFLHYSGRYTDHTGISVHDLVRSAKERYAINAVSASAGPTPPSRYAEPNTYLSVQCNMDISRVCVWAATSYFSAGNFERSEALARRALQGLALSPARSAAAASRSPRQGGFNGFDSCHAAAPTIQEKLHAASKCVTQPAASGQSVGGGGYSHLPHPVTSLSFDRACEDAQALVRFFASRDYRNKHQGSH